MKHTKKLLAFLLSLTMIGVMTAVPASAATVKGSQYPTVFVHGMMGWGSYEGFSGTIDYYGLACGSEMKDLKANGYSQLYEASVGPLSSGWDRACELYAQLTGTRVDYGVLHSKKYGHERYGRDYSKKPLIPGFHWDGTHKLNFVGHSFGATTIRLLSDMMAYGRPDEVAAAKKAGTQPSGLFTGGKATYIYSITTLSGTNNGTTYCYALPGLTNGSVALYTLWSYALSILGMSQGVHDFQLDQFGIKSTGGAANAAEDILTRSDFLQHNDASIKDFEIDRQVQMNKQIRQLPNVFYFCYPSNSSQKSSSGTYVPISKTFVVLKDYVRAMGRYKGVSPGQYEDGFGSYKTTVKVTPTTLDESWWPNDGFVNVIGQTVPFHYENGKKTYDRSVVYHDGMAVKPGVWHVMPEYRGDHFGHIGVLFTENSSDVKNHYRNIMSRIYSCSLNI